MTSPAFENESLLNYNNDFFKQDFINLNKQACSNFKSIVRFHFLFNLFFISVIFVEVVYFFAQLSYLAQTFSVAVHLALIFALLFFYFTLHTYFSTRKIEKFIELRGEFVSRSRQIVQEPFGMPEHHQYISEKCCEFASELYGGEYYLYRAPRLLSFLSASLERLNCLLFWKDFHAMKELLLQVCVEENVEMVKIQPTDLEAHASLANAYVMLSGLYIDPRKIEGFDEKRWIPSSKYNEIFQRKFRFFSEKAIEEFKILSDYAPDDPWVHAQLAYSYRDLGMPEEEIKEYEILLRLCPDDRETLFKLGKLYFSKGENAKGLQVYNLLKKSNYKKAEQLICFYDAKDTLSKMAF